MFHVTCSAIPFKSNVCSTVLCFSASLMALAPSTPIPFPSVLDNQSEGQRICRGRSSYKIRMSPKECPVNAEIFNVKLHQLTKQSRRSLKLLCHSILE